VTQTDETGYEDDDGRDAGSDDDLDGPDEDLDPADDGFDDGPEEGNRVLAPVANAVLGHIARSIVDDPDAVEVETIPLRAGKVRLAVRVAPNDFGRLIGRRGRIAAAVRTLVSAAAVRDGLDVEVEFVE
jgi:predicted RNA-binding protein YlqC (UPF0109 family)